MAIILIRPELLFVAIILIGTELLLVAIIFIGLTTRLDLTIKHLSIVSYLSIACSFTAAFNADIHTTKWHH